MKTIIGAFIIGLSLFVSGCNTTKPTLIKPSLTVIMPPEEFFTKCRTVGLPDPNTLTDDQVAKLIVRMWAMNKTCVETVQAIKEYLESSKKIIENQNP